MSNLALISVLVLVFFVFLIPVVFANGEHASGEEHDDHETVKTEGTRLPVLVGGAIAILVVAVLAYKFVVK